MAIFRPSLPANFQPAAADHPAALDPSLQPSGTIQRRGRSQPFGPSGSARSRGNPSHVPQHQISTRRGGDTLGRSSVPQSAGGVRTFQIIRTSPRRKASMLPLSRHSIGKPRRRLNLRFLPSSGWKSQGLRKPSGESKSKFP